jgi:hypothetical protein
MTDRLVVDRRTIIPVMLPVPAGIVITPTRIIALGSIAAGSIAAGMIIAGGAGIVVASGSTGTGASPVAAIIAAAGRAGTAAAARAWLPPPP